MKRWAFRWVGSGYFVDRQGREQDHGVDVFVPVELDAETEAEHSSESESEKPSMDNLGAQQWVVWSEEHLAWWRPNRCGYTNSLRQAGRYSEQEAKAIQFNANSCGPEPAHHRFNEVAMPLPDDFDAMLDRKTQR